MYMRTPLGRTINLLMVAIKRQKKAETFGQAVTEEKIL
jgi:hypothetical protein